MSINMLAKQLSFLLLICIGATTQADELKVKHGIPDGIPRFSDQRLKENIESLKYNPDLIHIIQPFILQDASGNSQSLGFSIENLETVDTRLLVANMETSITPDIDLTGIAAILVSEVKALRAEVDALKADQRVGY